MKITDRTPEMKVRSRHGEDVAEPTGCVVVTLLVRTNDEFKALRKFVETAGDAGPHMGWEQSE